MKPTFAGKRQNWTQKKSETVVFASDFLIEDVLSIYNLEAVQGGKIGSPPTD